MQMVAMAVIIFGFWNVPVVRNFINPLKLFAIGWHELCHISAVCTRAPRVLFVLVMQNAQRFAFPLHILGYPHWRAHTQNHDRSACRGSDDRGGRQSVVHAFGGIHRLNAAWRRVYTGRLGHFGGEGHELCARCGASASIGSRAG